MALSTFAPTDAFALAPPVFKAWFAECCVDDATRRFCAPASRFASRFRCVDRLRRPPTPRAIACIKGTDPAPLQWEAVYLFERACAKPDDVISATDCTCPRSAGD